MAPQNIQTGGATALTGLDGLVFVEADPVDTHTQIMAWLDAGRFTFAELDAWLREHTTDVRGTRGPMR